MILVVAGADPRIEGSCRYARAADARELIDETEKRMAIWRGEDASEWPAMDFEWPLPDVGVFSAQLDQDFVAVVTPRHPARYIHLDIKL